MKAGESLVDLMAPMTSTVASMVASWVAPMEASMVAPVASMASMVASMASVVAPMASMASVASMVGICSDGTSSGDSLASYLCLLFFTVFVQL